MQYEALALFDSGCTRTSIDKMFVRMNKIPTRPSKNPIAVRNADGSINGWVKDYVDAELEVRDSEGNVHLEQIELQVVNLGGKHNMFIGYDWFEKHNPSIDWARREFTLSCDPNKCDLLPAQEGGVSIQDYLNELRIAEEEGLYNEDQYIRAFQTKSTELAAEAHKEQQHRIPPQYDEFKDVFEKLEFDKLPERRPWDHKIELLPAAEADRKLKGKIYPMNPEEQSALDAFLEENLKSGRIRKSQSPVAAPFFFVKKKDSGLRPVQDYRRLNAATIKDSYPLPLIADVLTRIKDAKIFSKFDVRWGFNNVRI